MINRVRDKIRARPQQNISWQEWEQIEERYMYANWFFQEHNPIYIMLKASLDDAKEVVYHNRIREVREFHVVTEILQKIFTIPVKVQADELVGQIKLIEELFASVALWKENKEELEKLEGEGVISIERSKERGR